MLKKSGKLNDSLISLQENKMPNHHSIVGCTSGYKPRQEWLSTEFVASFHYPFSKPELLQKWITFTDWKDWTLNSFQRDVWKTFSWRCYESRVTKSQPYHNEEGTSLWKLTAQWKKHWIKEKTYFDYKFGARSVARFQAWRLHFIECRNWWKALSTRLSNPYRFSNVKPKIQ